MKTTVEEEVHRVVNRTADMHLEFLVSLSDAVTEATTWSITDTDCVADQWESVIYAITSNQQMHFKTEFSICLIEYKVWWNSLVFQELRKAIEQCVIHFSYPTMHHVSHISLSIRCMDSADNFTTTLSEQLHIDNVNEAYQSRHQVN